MKYALLGSFLFLLGACQISPCGINKTSFLAKHDHLVDKAKENRDRWEDKDWEASDKKMKEFAENCYEQYEDDLTNKEASRFWTRTASYYVTRYGKGFVKELGRDESEIADILEKGIESVSENPEEFLREILRENGGAEIKEALNELGDELKDLGKELDKWLNE
ncbi:MAG: hypothetical protein HKN16_00605 [Saprospiraceae bacterium]|nr:hypothetical protein [Saprospiraceae bacterium]